MNTWNFYFPEGSCQLYFCVFPPVLPARHKVRPKFVRSRRRSSAGSRRSIEAGSAVASVPPMAMRRQSVRLCITAPRRCRLSRSTSRRPVAKSTCGLNVWHERTNLLRCVRPFMAQIDRHRNAAIYPESEQKPTLRGSRECDDFDPQRKVACPRERGGVMSPNTDYRQANSRR